MKISLFLTATFLFIANQSFAIDSFPILSLLKLNCGTFLTNDSTGTLTSIAQFQQKLDRLQKSYARIEEHLNGKGLVVTPYFEAMEIAPKVHFLRFPNQPETTKSFMRMQEHYESPEFRGKVFSTTEFRKWYKKNYGKNIDWKYGLKTKVFSYDEDWGGFNFPSYALDAFYKGSFTHLTEREKRILNFFEPMRGHPFYVISSFRRELDETASESSKLNAKWRELITDRHEITHAFYSMVPEYKLKVDTILAEAPQEVKKSMRDYLIQNMYAEAVIDDEINAYLTSEWYKFVINKRFSFSSIESTVLKLNQAFEETYLSQSASQHLSDLK